MSETIVVGTGPPPDIGKLWWVPFVAGLLTMLCGLIALVWPGPTLVVIGVLLGIYLMLWGVMITVRGVLDPDAPNVGLRVLAVLLGVVSILAGLVLMMRPEESVLAAAWIIGFWWALTGVMRVIHGIADPDDRALNIVIGLIGIVGGVIILGSPHIGVITLLLIVGIGLLIQGAIETVLGWNLRKLHKEGAL